MFSVTMLTYTILGRTPSKKTDQRIITVKTKTGKYRPVLLPNKKYSQWIRGAVSQLKADHVKQGHDEPLDGPLEVKAVIHRATKHRCDLVNILQSIHDALEDAGVIVNDRLIKSVDGSRLMLGANPGAERAVIWIDRYTPESDRGEPS